MWKIDCIINKEDIAAKTAVEHIRTLADSAHGDGSFSLSVDETLPGFRIDVSPTDRTVTIAARDTVHLLYAAYDFEVKYLPLVANSNFYEPVTLGDVLPEWHHVTAPTHTRRGLWTWGYVIRDYRGYIDRMVSLKMNTLILWNDYPPQNSRELIDYAHAYGVRVYYGYAWGWDTHFDTVDPAHTEALTDAVAKEYEEKYAPLGLDGIYFQSFTELSTDTLAGVNIAEAVTTFVNRTAGVILEKHPDLDILFGLHASSVRNHLDAIAKTDPRVSILWEDSGAFPYHYEPYAIDNFTETLDFHNRTKNLRTPGGFGAVLKGMTKLDWRHFRHQSGDFLLGEDGADAVKKNADERRKWWRFLQAYWMRNAEEAVEMLRHFGRDDTVTFLVEDGAIEAYLPYPLALAAEMLWDDTRDAKDILTETALRADVEFM